MNLIETVKKIAPEVVDILDIRYNILRNIYFNQPIGRRSLANQLNIGERSVRTEVNILKEQGLLKIESMGMYITDEGKNITKDLEEVIMELKDISNLEKRLEKLLNIENAIIVPGNSDESSLALKDMGKITSLYLQKSIKDDFIIGVTGGTTMAQVVEEMPSGKVSDNVLIIPARGGLGEDVETQSNNIAAKLANKLKGSYKLLHVPDNIDQETLEALSKVADVNEVIQLIDKMNVLIFGIGRADTMAERRHLSEERIDMLGDKGVVGEAFGHYFDINGVDVWKSLTVGINLEIFKNVDIAIAVAGGKNKAEAIIAVTSLRQDITLVTDEAAANKIISIVDKATE